MVINGVNFLLGSDPEVFVKDKKTRRFVGAYGMTDGTKRNPAPLAHNIRVQVDGMALEFNTNPSSGPVHFARVVARARRELNCLIERQGDYRIVVQPTVEFDEEAWADAPDVAKVLGCEPDYNAWTMDVNERPDADVTFRTGGGHLHMGWGAAFELDDRFLKVCGGFTREQDVTNGVASVLYDTDVGRRELYGRAGAFRPKHYGMEYRTLSNSWVRNKELSTYVARQSFVAASNMMTGNLMQTPEVESIINESKIEEAKYFLGHNKLSFPPAKYRKA